MSDRDIALQLADYLAILRANRSSGSDPITREHAAKLAQWEKLVRENSGGTRMSEHEASTKAMNVIKFLALRRFNYIDSTGNFAAFMSAYNGFYVLGGIVFIFTILTSVYAEMIAEKAKRCHAK